MGFEFQSPECSLVAQIIPRPGKCLLPGSPWDGGVQTVICTPRLFCEPVGASRGLQRGRTQKNLCFPPSHIRSRFSVEKTRRRKSELCRKRVGTWFGKESQNSRSPTTLLLWINIYLIRRFPPFLSSSDREVPPGSSALFPS